MSTSKPGTYVLHPTDFSLESHVAFVHALKTALCTGGRLELLHVAENASSTHWSEFPRVRELLESWKLLPPDARRRDVSRLGITVEKTLFSASEITPAIVDFIRTGDREPDLIILATHGRTGLDRLTHENVAEPLMRATHIPTLFFPPTAEGFVDISDGQPNLARILIPFDAQPSPRSAIRYAEQFAATFKADTAQFTYLHVGKHDAAVNLLSSSLEVGSELQVMEGPVAESILEYARQWRADLIVMATEGHHGFLDAFRGSTTERVVHHSPCPVLAAPAFNRE